MDVSIVVNHYKEPQMLKLALKYIYDWKDKYEKNGKIAEIIVTDSETMSETKEMMLDLYPHTTFLTEEKNIGFGKSVNRALNIAQGKYIFIMNADFVIPKSQELNKLIDYLSENKNVGIVGPKLLNFDNTHQPSAFRYYTPRLIALRRTPLGKLPGSKKMLNEFMLHHHENLLKEPTEVDWLMGSALLTKKEYLDKIGGFDERYFMYMEDVDLCRRFWENKLKVVYFPDSEMYHFHGKSSQSKNIFKSLGNKYTRIHLVSAWKYFKKHGLKTPRYGV